MELVQYYKMIGGSFSGLWTQTSLSTYTIDTAFLNMTGWKLPLWLSEIIISIGLILVSWLVFFLFRRYGVKICLPWKIFHHDCSHEVLVKHLKTPISLILFAIGIFITLDRLFILRYYHSDVKLLFKALFICLGAFIFIRTVKASLEIYAHNTAQRTASAIDNQFIPSLRRVFSAIIWIAAFIMVLDNYDIKITTLVTTLGIGGLAVALALQDSLANFFSGFYLMMDKPVRYGDFVKLENGSEGFIESIGWRSTRIRSLGNNVIVIPNSKLAQSTITNYYLSEGNNTFPVECRVLYGQNLDIIEQICLETAHELINKMEGTDHSFEPIVRYYGYTDNYIQLRVILAVTDFRAQYLIKHEYIKALNRRLIAEKITMVFLYKDVPEETLPVTVSGEIQKEAETQLPSGK
jgi:small-conductance mechanosensitive channel